MLLEKNMENRSQHAQHARWSRIFCLQHVETGHLDWKPPHPAAQGQDDEEEGHFVPAEQWDDASPRIRHGNPAQDRYIIGTPKVW